MNDDCGACGRDRETCARMAGWLDDGSRCCALCNHAAEGWEALPGAAPEPEPVPMTVIDGVQYRPEDVPE